MADSWSRGLPSLPVAELWLETPDRPVRQRVVMKLATTLGATETVLEQRLPCVLPVSRGDLDEWLRATGEGAATVGADWRISNHRRYSQSAGSIPSV